MHVAVGYGSLAMAQLTAFSYRSGNSYAHALDVRIKLILLMLVSLAVMDAGPTALGVMSLCLMILVRYLHLPLKSVCVELRYFLILLALVFIARSLSTAGDPLIVWKWLTISREGMKAGAVVVWRIMLVVLVGLTFVATTRPTEIKAAVEWFLKPVPLIPRARIGTMIGLVLRFIPLIFTQAGETLDAQRARAVEHRKNPYYRLTKFVIPFFRRTFETADKLAVAMEARCYSENRTNPQFSARRRDFMVLAVCAVFCCLIFLF